MITDPTEIARMQAIASDASEAIRGRLAAEGALYAAADAEGGSSALTEAAGFLAGLGIAIAIPAKDLDSTDLDVGWSAIIWGASEFVSNAISAVTRTFDFQDTETYRAAAVAAAKAAAVAALQPLNRYQSFTIRGGRGERVCLVPHLRDIQRCKP